MNQNTTNRPEEVTEMETIIHQVIDIGVACGVRPFHWKTHPAEADPSGATGYDLGNAVDSRTRVTCPKCLAIPVKRRGGYGSPFIIKG